MANMEYLKNKPIAVLGAGGIGKACAADCAMAGNTVRICDLPPFSEKTLWGIEKQGIRLFGNQDSLYGFERSGVGRMSMVTEDVAECVKDAGIIIVATTATGHKGFFEKLIPALEDGMVIHIIPDNYGSLLLRKMMREAGCTKKVIVGGWSSAPYGSRVSMEGGLTLPKTQVIYRAINLRCATLPSLDQEAFIESANYMGCMDAVTQGDGAEGGDTVLDIGFSNINPILHVPGTLLGVSTMENWGKVLGTYDKKDFSIYSHAYCPSISKVQYAVYQEEVALATAVGVGIQSFEKRHFFTRRNLLGPEMMGPDFILPFEEQDYMAMGTGPHSIYNRYVTEDIPVGCCIFHALGKRFDVATPMIDSMINIGSVMTDTNYFENGYTLDYIGIGDMTKKELHAYLREGIVK